MFWNLLTSTSSGSSSSSGATAGGCSLPQMLPFLLIIGAFAVLWFFSRRSQKKQQDQINATLDAIQPGNKVKTIGGICGVVVEVCPEDNTFVMETGSETTGKSYLKLDKKSVYQTDAVPVTEQAPVEESAEATTEEAPFEEVQTPVEETTEVAEEVEEKEE